MDLELKNITKSFPNESPIFKDFNLKIKTGDFVTILGSNGIGKTTLLNIISGLDKNYSGQILNKPEIAYCIQKSLLFPWLSVYKNIILGLEIQKRLEKNTKEKVLEYLNDFEFPIDKLDIYPNNLSGGEKQKIALIRSLILGHNFLLLDEPFSALDYRIRSLQQIKLHNLSKKYNQTVILITHDIDEAINISDRIIILKKQTCRNS